MCPNGNSNGKKRKIFAMGSSADLASIVRLVYEPISIPTTRELLSGNFSMGAVATFEGVTRDYFEDKIVVELEYEAYEEMAVKTMHEIIKAVRTSIPDLGKVVIIHRLGLCPVGETSLYIACLSSHRKPSLDALPLLLDELKAKVPIWKLEKYASQQAEWKANAEWRSKPA